LVMFGWNWCLCKIGECLVEIGACVRLVNGSLYINS